MKKITTQILTPISTDIQTAAQLLHNSAIVSFPTETVYGLGADARNSTAVAKIYAAKQRPSFNPLIVHVNNLAHAEKYALFTDRFRRLADIFWPGPISFVLPIAPNSNLSELVTAGLNTIAIRVPNNLTALALLDQFNGPIAAPSANISGKVSSTTAAHVLYEMNGKIDAIIDGGPCNIGLESTIIAEGENITLLRSGGIPLENLEQVLNQKLSLINPTDSPTSPGQLTSHYAPKLPLRNNILSPKPTEAYLGFGTKDGDFNLSPSGDLIEAASNLFSYLRQIDDFAILHKKTAISVAPIPINGLGLAINDRLQRAGAIR